MKKKLSVFLTLFSAGAMMFAEEAEEAAAASAAGGVSAIKYIAAAIAVGAAASETAQDTDAHSAMILPLTSQKSISKVSSLGKVNDATNPSNMSKNFR